MKTPHKMVIWAILAILSDLSSSYPKDHSGRMMISPNLPLSSLTLQGALPSWARNSQPACIYREVSPHCKQWIDGDRWLWATHEIYPRFSDCCFWLGALFCFGHWAHSQLLPLYSTDWLSIFVELGAAGNKYVIRDHVEWTYKAI